MATIPASENVFPIIRLDEVAAPSTPPSGEVHVYAKSDGLLYWKDDAGTEYNIAEAIDTWIGLVRNGLGVPDGTARAMSNANQAAFRPLIGTGAITKLGIEVATSSGNICAAIYGASGSGRDTVPAARKATTGSIACPAAGYRELDLGGSVTIEVGDWVFFSADNTTATFFMCEDAGGGLATNLMKGVSYYKGVLVAADPAAVDGAALLRMPFMVGVP
jgi:hypothetical protein